MTEVTLHILDGPMLLDVCRRSAAKRLMRKVGDPYLLGQRLQVLLQVVADAEGCSSSIEKEKGVRVLALGMNSNPFGCGYFGTTIQAGYRRRWSCSMWNSQ